MARATIFPMLGGETIGPVPGSYNDGYSPHNISVSVAVRGDVLVISAMNGEEVVRWTISKLRMVPGATIEGELRLRHGHEQLDRLTIRDQALADYLRRTVRKLKPEPIFDFRRLRLVFGLMSVMVATIALTFILVVPMIAQSLAIVVPSSWESQLGSQVRKAIIEDLARSTGQDLDQIECNGTIGSKMLDKMVARLEPHIDSKLPLKVSVVKLDSMNAFAMPGGHIIIFDGLLRFARNADEVAGVLAHEAAHVERHHPNRKLIESGSTTVVLSLLFGDFGGRDLVLNLGRLLFTASYSRTMELEADRDAVETLQRAGVDAVPLARFLERIAARQGHLEERIGWLLSHPVSSDRAVAIRKLVTPGRRTPVLDEGEFSALRLICRGDQRSPSERIRRRPWDTGSDNFDIDL